MSQRRFASQVREHERDEDMHSGLGVVASKGGGRGEDEHGRRARRAGTRRAHSDDTLNENEEDNHGEGYTPHSPSLQRGRKQSCGDEYLHADVVLRRHM